MKLDAARKFAMSLPETTEEPHFEKSSFRVKGKVFATMPPDGKHLHILVGPEEKAALITEKPAVFEEVGRGRSIAPDWVRVTLAGADRVQICELLEEAWRLKAPTRVLAAFDAERTRSQGAGSR